MAKVLAKVRHLMDLSKITTSTLEALVKLTKKRDVILGELKKIETALGSIYSGRKSAPSTGRRRKAKGPRRAGARTLRAAAAPPSGRRGALKARILAALRTAGDKGVAVKELSAKLGVKNQ